MSKAIEEVFERDIDVLKSVNLNSDLSRDEWYKGVKAYNITGVDTMQELSKVVNR